MPRPPVSLLRVLEQVSKSLDCNCDTPECIHVVISNLSRDQLQFITSLNQDTTCCCDTDLENCAHYQLKLNHNRILELIDQINSLPSQITTIPRVSIPKFSEIQTLSPRDSYHSYFSQPLRTHPRTVLPPVTKSTTSKVPTPERKSPEVPETSTHRPSVVIADTPPQQIPSVSVSPVSDSEDEAMAHPEPQAHSSRFDFTIVSTDHVVQEPDNDKYVGWSYHAALAGVDDYVTLPTLLLSLKQIRRRSFHIKAQRDEVVDILNGMTTVQPPAPGRRFPPNTVLVNISNGVIADLLDKLRSALDVGERYIQDAHTDTKRLGSLDDAKLTFHKVVQRINSIPQSAPPDQLAVYGIYSSFI